MTKLQKRECQLRNKLQSVERIQDLEASMTAEVKALDAELDRLASEYAEGRKTDSIHGVDIDTWYLDRLDARHSCKAYLDLAYRAGKILSTTNQGVSTGLEN